MFATPASVCEEESTKSKTCCRWVHHVLEWLEFLKQNLQIIDHEKTVGEKKKYYNIKIFL